MKSSRCRVVALLFAVLVIVAVTGCPGTDTLSNNNGTLSFEIVATGDTGAYDCVVLAMPSMNILPQDGTCAGGGNDGTPCFLNQDCDSDVCAGATASTFVGQDGFPVDTGLLGDGSGVRGNLLGGTCDPQNPTLDPFLKGLIEAGEFFQPRGMTLPAGLYKLDNLVVQNAYIYIDENSVGEPGFCDDCGLNSCLFSPVTLTDAYTDNDLWFTVSPGQSKVIRFEFDVDQMKTLVPGFLDCNAFKANVAAILPVSEVG